tara:strand:- start:1905 stop:2210 length:306 start_codon:yes stop_codon:yes gene_type:complete
LPNIKFTVSLVIFSLLLFCTSVIKNKTNIIEKNIIFYEKQIYALEKELNESQLEFNYLTSPQILKEKLSFLTNDQFQNMVISNIYLDYKSFILDQTKITQK